MARSSTSFKPGQSGNPAGRPRLCEQTTMREAARQHTGVAVQVLSEIALDRSTAPGLRLTAARELLRRAYGGRFALSGARPTGPLME